ncbi:YicC/YloC family endoribonuclease [Phreatobacter oligotrophus]|uniref:YicC/YloC family endoribonuclease n=1 Tax=Phreatobacter oligotrophus TaxID=1122261 RepID=UPI00235202D9|nr:YicC/YloC family endoribonuclease [Phreatobacter oligotrophus]MBX9990410.1 YicC family protein [Phreatobacter oligotrophus]
MALSSMTGFARAEGVTGAAVWAWEIKSVNSKGLDVKLRLPGSLEAAEPQIRQAIAAAVSRGSVFASLSVKREGATSEVRINEAVLAQVVEAARLVAEKLDARAPAIDGLLAIKGVIDVVEAEETEEERAALIAAILAGLDTALARLVAMRREEGRALEAVLVARLDEIAALKAEAEDNPCRRPETIRARIAEQIAALLEPGRNFDPDRLHQEALMVASKADIREELDRLDAHVGAARKLLAGGGAVGRKLDFLAQEFNRETNTLCSKSNDVTLTSTGLALKAVVEQFREQVQNLE